ncbi:hypothetical protein CH255_22565 [Rhodococcus sp. 05-2255-2A2]|nr:hypothetical protein CH250_24285 [Rhodococcus sp. 05-2255-3C]OZE14960.1 hypothetical protein CH255_22565 [Rhodococcus sp. 05-2255-2A2]
MVAPTSHGQRAGRAPSNTAPAARDRGRPRQLRRVQAARTGIPFDLRGNRPAVFRSGSADMPAQT